MFRFGGSFQSRYSYSNSETPMPQYSESTVNESSVHEKILGTKLLMDVPKEITSGEPVLKRPDYSSQLPGKPCMIINDDTDSAEIALNACDQSMESIDEPLSLLQMAEYLKCQGYITDDIFQKILQAPRDNQTLKKAFLDAKKKTQNKTKEIVANYGDDSCKPLLQYLEALTCQSCEQCKILNRYKKELKCLQNLDMVNKLCEEKSVVEVTCCKRSAKGLFKALRIAVHKDSKTLEVFAGILKESGNLGVFELIWNDYCTAFGNQENDNTSEELSSSDNVVYNNEGRGLEEPTEQL